MPHTTGIVFKCGEFVPGGEPIVVGDIRPPSPNVLVSEPKDVPPLVPPFIPPSQPDPKWACVYISPGDPTFVNLPPAGPGFEWSVYGECRKCDGLPNGKPYGSPINPKSDDPDCTFINKANCEPNCPKIKQEIPSGGTLEPVTITPGGATLYKCQQLRYVCPEDEGLPESEQRVLALKHFCKVCNSLEANGNANLSSTGPPVLKNNQLVYTRESGCIYTTKTDCENSCGNAAGPTTGPPIKFVTSCDEAVSVITEPLVNGESFDIEIVDIKNLGENQNNIVQAGPTPNSDPATQGAPTINFGSQIFHSTYNFFSTRESVAIPSNGTNSSYLNIFKNEVAPNVANLISRENSNSSWNESMLFSLTLDQIEFSLRPELVSAFRSIHRMGGQLVGLENFLRMVKKHLVTGTLSEFDPDYYLQLASNQKNDRRVSYKGLNDKDINSRAALGLVSQGAIITDSSQLINLQQRQGRRERRFNTDIDAKTLVDPISLETTKDLYLSDGGIDVITLDNTNIAVPIGNGDGYYFHVQRLDETDVSIATLNDASNTFYVPPDSRYNILTLLQQDTSYVLQAEAASGQNEFVAGDKGASALKPLYLKLDLNSMKYDANANPLVSRYNGSYIVETDQDIIDEHSTNNGLAITRVNIHYSDPIYRYILDTGKVNLSLNDLNFKTILDPKDYPGGVRIARNMPFGLIITPVAGSKFNPFNGQSDLISFDEPFTRVLRLTPDINVDDNKPIKPELDEVNLFKSTGGDLKVGLVEPNDSQNVIYKYDASNERYTNTFYSNGSYGNNITSVSSNGLSYMIKEVIDYLIQNYNAQSISWYDVISRMPINQIGSFLYDTNETLISELERGFRGGLSINSVLNTVKDVDGLFLPEDDKTIIKKGER